MTALRHSGGLGLGVGYARTAKIAALGLGFALFASGCGGNNSESTSEESTGSSDAAAASVLTCPEGEGGTGSDPGAKGDASAVPASTGTTDVPLKIGSLLPTTGSLAYLGPPEIAGVNLAVKEINDAGGVLGKPVEVVHRDSGDTTTDIATQSVNDLLSQDVSAIVGAASSGVSKTVIGNITGAGVIQFSPANTSPDFTTWDDNGLYFRTAPSDVMQGRTLGNYIMSCGAQTVGMIVLNDAYGTGLQSNVQKSVEDAGGQVVASEMFNEGDSQFSSQVDSIAAAKPDAVVIISFDQAKSIVPLLKSKGIDASQMFFVDGNTSDYSDSLDAGTLEGAQGTIPGPFASDNFKDSLLAIDPALKDWSYAGESYDAVTLLALASEAAGSTDGKAMAAELQGVSGEGEKCYDFAGCVTILRGGGDIDYDGYSGPVTFDENGDPTEAFIGIYQYDADNKPVPSRSEEGKL
ncbi:MULTISPECIES: ABC transporter substrate-binding protein [unclassified Arthrobacter]|uniref:ABC transporter substrate-binding protein n=1 Tax=unclassified Arthrobacter TaxID=235627 RepID=UPI001D137FD0|nr:MULTISPECIES: ABC transporter substrate-binding protein [unclassified Arthrobacter]MCC3277477.1 ABC transporter substrate-binding protein [Arthrobacter sp. zg-Y20]MCC9178152.1 ABC transporter substrate-binding protein [Arthrobacter sp. zg-Y750]MDK1317638.1 ABC transporter substrate-binding protein [Arthrobacter sp. zg.Y20]WIB07101.1 ABC transporter substrate-binding protein [Arthrobacter sp. zg-Y20]